MSMTKQDFIALADTLKAVRASYSPSWDPNLFRACDDHIKALANDFEQRYPAFDRARWLGYIKGENGRSGGSIGPINGSKLSRRGNPAA